MSFKKIFRKPVFIGVIVLAIVALGVGTTMVVTASAAGPAANANLPGKNVTFVQGKIASISSTSISITTTSGTTTGTVNLALDGNTNFSIHGNVFLQSLSGLVGQSVSAVYSNGQTANPPVAASVMINMPVRTPPAKTPPAAGNMPMRPFNDVSGTVASISGNSMSINLTNGAGTLAANQTVVILPVITPPTTATPGIAPKPAFTRVVGTVASISGNTLTITLTNGAGTLATGQAVTVITAQAPNTDGHMMPGFRGPFGGFGGKPAPNTK